MYRREGFCGEVAKKTVTQKYKNKAVPGGGFIPAHTISVQATLPLNSLDLSVRAVYIPRPCTHPPLCKVIHDSPSVLPNLGGGGNHKPVIYTHTDINSLVLIAVRNFLYRKYKPRLKQSLYLQHEKFKIEAASCPEITAERTHIPKQNALELICTQNCIKFFIHMFRLFLQYLKLTIWLSTAAQMKSHILSNNTNTFYT